MTSNDRDRVLFVGLSCFDIATYVDGYPSEDSDKRATNTAIRRGGNASNSCTCFAALLRWLEKRKTTPHPDVKVKIPEDISRNRVEFFGTLAEDVGGNFMEEDMNKRGVLTEQVVKYKDAVSGIAVILVNNESGSRTIIHCVNKLPELTTKDFSDRIDVSNYRWIHLEARKNIDEVVGMVRYIRSSDPERRVTVSVELEKPTSSRDMMWDEDVDYFICSKDYAKFQGAQDPSSALDLFLKMLPEKQKSVGIIVPWGELGCYAIIVERSRGEEPKISRYSSPSFRPKNGVVDTTGAGDSFIAGTIFSLEFLTVKDLEKSIQFGCKFAGAKCGSFGNEGLDDFEQFL
jgi:ketohexokinase